MNKKITVFLAALIVLASFLAYQEYQRSKNETAFLQQANIQQSPISKELAAPPSDSQANLITNGFISPLDRASERVTKKPFGLFATSQNSPVQPEHFSGYHTGTDFEIFPGEENVVVSVKAVCSGQLLVKRSATGYGGVAVESCSLNGELITVIYGHLKLTSINFNVGDKINAGDTLGILGVPYSTETSGERKHLHLGFHKGTSTNILGYVQNKAELSGWLDACLYVCGN